MAKKLKYKSPIFLLESDGKESIIRSAGDNRTDGIVTGIIVSLIAFPLLIGSMLLGGWIIYLASIEDTPLVVLMMGGVFLFGGFGLFKLFSGSLMAFFPFRWIIRKDIHSWEIQKYVFGIKVFRGHCDSWSLQCLPSYSRGDWGFYFLLCIGVRKIRMTPPCAFKKSKNAASIVAERDSEALQSHFGVECQLLKWD